MFSNGGLDANWLDKHGIPTVTIGAGQAEIHTIKEYVNLAEFEKGCRLGDAAWRRSRISRRLPRPVCAAGTHRSWSYATQRNCDVCDLRAGPVRS